jgi:hypothetical protein
MPDFRHPEFDTTVKAIFPQNSNPNKLICFNHLAISYNLNGIGTQRALMVGVARQGFGTAGDKDRKLLGRAKLDSHTLWYYYRPAGKAEGARCYESVLKKTQVISR